MLIVRRRSGRETSRIQQEMEELFRAMVVGSPSLARTSFGRWRPRIEVYESDGALVVTAEVAGICEQDLSVVVDDSVLRISGVRPNPAKDHKRTYYEMGIPYGPFEAEIFLPFSVVLDAVEAAYDNGFLRVTLPRPQATRIVPRATTTSTSKQER
ncbi:MAG TPA: Hsp20/alpha crystallin family protein [Nitrolancea sp.]|nr:Hsp20/alpha crystallin family protein [Nitrolancea sp.]